MIWVGRWEVGWFGLVGQDGTYVWYYFELELFGKREKTHEEHCVELKMGLAQLVEFRKRSMRRVRERVVDGGDVSYGSDQEA